MKIRIENCLIANNKNAARGYEPQVGTIKNYFLVKNIINFYLQTFSSVLAEESSFVYLIRELLILSDKVFYNSLNFYCSSKMSQKLDMNQPQSATVVVNRSSAGSLEQIDSFVQLVDELLECIKSSMSFNVQEQQLETHRILSSVVEPFMQYVVIYSSKLSSIEMTVFSFNATHSLKTAISRYQFTQSFGENLQKQLDQFVEVLVNEQFQQLINSLCLTALHNAILQNDNLTGPLSLFSGCDPIAVNSFLVCLPVFLSSCLPASGLNLNVVDLPESLGQVC